MQPSGEHARQSTGQRHPPNQITLTPTSKISSEVSSRNAGFAPLPALFLVGEVWGLRFVVALVRHVANPGKSIKRKDARAQSVQWFE